MGCGSLKSSPKLHSRGISRVNSTEDAGQANHLVTHSNMLHLDRNMFQYNNFKEHPRIKFTYNPPDNHLPCEQVSLAQETTSQRRKATSLQKDFRCCENPREGTQPTIPAILKKRKAMSLKKGSSFCENPRKEGSSSHHGGQMEHQRNKQTVNQRKNSCELEKGEKMESAEFAEIQSQRKRSANFSRSNHRLPSEKDSNCSKIENQQIPNNRETIASEKINRNRLNLRNQTSNSTHHINQVQKNIKERSQSSHGGEQMEHEINELTSYPRIIATKQKEEEEMEKGEGFAETKPRRKKSANFSRFNHRLPSEKIKETIASEKINRNRLNLRNKTNMKTEPSAKFSFTGQIQIGGEDLISFLRKRTEVVAQQKNKTVQIRLSGKFEANREKVEEVENEEMIDTNLRNSRGKEKDHWREKESDRRSAQSFNGT